MLMKVNDIIVWHVVETNNAYYWLISFNAIH